MDKRLNVDNRLIMNMVLREVYFQHGSAGGLLLTSVSIGGLFAIGG